ncbi:MAG: hypothetical protein AB1598_12380 [Thermodesulfobacteriota bacterium]
MILNDLALFSSLFLFQILLFCLLQIVILRIFAEINILCSSAVAVVLSVSSVTILSYFLVSGLFSTPQSYAVSAAGSGAAAVFACGLYTFLGPATADRSLACQLLVFLYGRAGTAYGLEELNLRFDSLGFIEKRINECRREDIIEDFNGTVVLTEKGKRIAKVYIFLLRSLGLRERSDYKEYFPNG